MRLVWHRVESQHDAWDFVYPSLGRGPLQESSAEHIVEGSVTSLVSSISLRVVGGGQDPLDAQDPQEVCPYGTDEFAPPVGEEAAWSAKVGDYVLK